MEEISSLLFDNFDRDEFERYCRELAIFPDSPDGVALKKSVQHSLMEPELS